MGNFTQDLKIGERAQDFIIKELQSEYPGIKSMQGNFSNYDLVSDSGYTAEVKFDRMSRNTGKVGIEYEYNNYPSGIAKTTAMDWVHIYRFNSQWVYSKMKVADLKSFTKSNWKHLRKVTGGDYGAAKLVLISIPDFAERFSFKTINPIT